MSVYETESIFSVTKQYFSSQVMMAYIFLLGYFSHGPLEKPER